MSDLKIHPAGPVVWAAIVVVIFYLWNRTRRIPAMADAGFGESVRNRTYYSEGAGISDNIPGTHIALNPYRAKTEPFPTQPVIAQNAHVIPFYRFLNQMFHSQSSAYLERKAYP